MSRVKRPWRRLVLRKRVLIPLGAGIGLFALAYFVLLPWVVRGRVDAVLRQLKLRDVTYRVTRATLWTSTVRDIDAGGGNRIDELRVTYSAGGLRHRQVDHIRITGLHLAADVRDGKVSLGPLDALFRGSATQPATSPSPPTAPETPADASAEDWPFRSIRIEDSELRARTPSRQITLPIEGHVEWPRFHVESKGLSIDGAVAGPGAPAIQFSGTGISGDDVSAIAKALAPSLPVRITGDVAAKGLVSHADGKTTFDIQLSAFTSAAEPATRLADTNLSLERGVFHLVGSVGENQSTVTLSATDVAVSESDFGAKASGIGGSIRFVNLSQAMATAPQQEVRAAKLTASKFELTDGVVRFDLAADSTLNVHDARASFLGGEVSVKATRIKPGEPIAVTLEATALQLNDLLALLAKGKATGEGTVTGELPLVILPDGTVRLGEGSFEARAGGRLSVTDADTLQSIAGEAARTAAQAPQTQVRNNIVEALKDFEFRKLTARLDNEGGKEPIAYVRLAGKGRTGTRQALEYDLRVTGLNDLLRELMNVHRSVTREAAKP